MKKICVCIPAGRGFTIAFRKPRMPKSGVLNRVGGKRDKKKDMDEYKVGNGSQQIKHATDITTDALAASKASAVFPSSPAGQSENATGDIPRQDIGQASTLRGKILRIATKIDLSIFPDQAAKKKEIDAIDAKYILEFGEDGYKVFDIPEKQVLDDFNTVILFKEIQLT